MINVLKSVKVKSIEIKYQKYVKVFSFARNCSLYKTIYI